MSEPLLCPRLCRMLQRTGVSGHLCFLHDLAAPRQPACLCLAAGVYRESVEAEMQEKEKG